MVARLLPIGSLRDWADNFLVGLGVKVIGSSFSGYEHSAWFEKFDGEEVGEVLHTTPVDASFSMHGSLGGLLAVQYVVVRVDVLQLSSLVRVVVAGLCGFTALPAVACPTGLVCNQIVPFSPALPTRTV